MFNIKVLATIVIGWILALKYEEFVPAAQEFGVVPPPIFISCICLINKLSPAGCSTCEEGEGSVIVAS